jgi:hypothetical protein
MLFDYTKGTLDPSKDYTYHVGIRTPTSTGYTYTDGTEDLATKHITFAGLEVVTSGQITGSVSIPKTDKLYHKIFYVDGNKLKQVNTEEELISSYGDIEGRRLYA